MDKWARRTFFVALVAALALFLFTISDFLLPVLLGAMLVVLAQPLGDWLNARLPNRPRIAALIATLAAFLGVVVPLALFVTFLAREVVVFIGRAQEFLLAGGAAALSRQAQTVLEWLPERLAASLPEPGEALGRALSTLGRWAGSQVGGVATAAGNVLINGFLTFVATYYLFLDGHRLADRVDRMLPLERRYERELFVEFRNTIVAVFYGTGVIGIVQGLLIWLSFAIARVPEAAVWGAIAIVTAFIPLLGSALVWVPVGLVLLVAGEPWRGVFVLAVGALVVSSVDNIMRPLLVKGRIRVHPLIVFLSIFGGLAAFGAIGVVLGPVVASLTMALLRIWERDFIGPHQPAAPPPPEPEKAPGGLAALQRPVRT